MGNFDFKEKQRGVINNLCLFDHLGYSYFSWQYISTDLLDISDVTRFNFSYSTPVHPEKGFRGKSLWIFRIFDAMILK